MTFRGVQRRLGFMGIVIDDITTADIPHYLEFLRAGFGGPLSDLGTDLGFVSRILRGLLCARGAPLRAVKRIAGYEAFVLIARHAGRPIGCLTVVGRKSPSLTGVYVIPEFRGQRIASRLIETAVNRLRHAGYVEAHATPLNAIAQHLVEKVGFVPYSSTAAYERLLPLELPAEPEFTIRRLHAGDLGGRCEQHGRPYDLGPIGRLFGIRTRRLAAVGPDGAAVAALLFAIHREQVGEVRPLLLRSGGKAGLIPILAEADRWYRRLGKEKIGLYVEEGDKPLGEIAQALGFTYTRSWTHLILKLNGGAD